MAYLSVGVLIGVSRSAKWFSCLLLYCQGVLISQLLRSEVGSGLLYWYLARDGPQIGLWYLLRYLCA